MCTNNRVMGVSVRFVGWNFPAVSQYRESQFFCPNPIGARDIELCLGGRGEKHGGNLESQPDIALFDIGDAIRLERSHENRHLNHVV